MARLVKDSPLHGIRGILGKDLLFRQVNGETIISFKSTGRRKKGSELQKRNRGKFREASSYAKAQMRIPERKAYYQKQAKKLKLPNAYTAAVTDFMRKPKIEEVKLEKQKGGNIKVRIKAYKKGFEVGEVRVIAGNTEGQEMTLKANRVGNCFWEVELEKDFQLRRVEGLDRWGKLGKWCG